MSDLWRLECYHNSTPNILLVPLLTSDACGQDWNVASLVRPENAPGFCLPPTFSACLSGPFQVQLDLSLATLVHTSKELGVGCAAGISQRFSRNSRRFGSSNPKRPRRLTGSQPINAQLNRRLRDTQKGLFEFLERSYGTKGDNGQVKELRKFGTMVARALVKEKGKTTEEAAGIMLTTALDATPKSILVVRPMSLSLL